jgi:hypothetical protein
MGTEKPKTPSKRKEKMNVISIWSEEGNDTPLAWVLQDDGAIGGYYIQFSSGRKSPIFPRAEEAESILASLGWVVVG